MNSDDFFSDLDDAALEELDILERHALKPPSPRVESLPLRDPVQSLNSDPDFTDFSFDIDEAGLQEIDAITKSCYQDSVTPPHIPTRIGLKDAPFLDCHSDVLRGGSPEDAIDLTEEAATTNDLVPSSPIRPVPPHLSFSSDCEDHGDPPQPTFPIQMRRRKRTVAITVLSSSPTASPVQPKRTRRVTITSPPAEGRRPKRQRFLPPKGHIHPRQRQFYDYEAAHSGDEVSHGSSDAEYDMERSSDRDFVTDLPATQAPISYDQSCVYRQSLLSQAPRSMNGGPSFVARPIRRGLFGVRGAGSRRAETVASSSPVRRDPDFDHYEKDGFVVSDEDFDDT